MFKIGDAVHCKDWVYEGTGVIVSECSGYDWSVKFKTPHRALHNGGGNLECLYRYFDESDMKHIETKADRLCLKLATE